MNKFFSFLFFFFAAAVSAVPVVFNKGLLDKQDARFAVVHHGVALKDNHVLRFLFLRPKLGAEFNGVFATVGKGLTPKVLDVVKLDTDTDVLDHFFAFSNCETFFAGFFGLFGANGSVTHKFFGGFKGTAGFENKTFDGLRALEDFTDFVFDKLRVGTLVDGSKLFGNLLTEGVPAHVVLFALKARFRL